MPSPTFDPNAPTAQAVYSASRLKWQKLGVTDPSGLNEWLTQAIAYVIEITGRYFADWPPPVYTDTSTGYAYDYGSVYYGNVLVDAGHAVPLSATPTKIPLAQQAVLMRTEQIAKQAQPGYVDTVTDDVTQSMSVGSYSETRRDTASLRGGRYAQKPLLNTHPGLNALIEALMTEERYEFWLYRLQGSYLPAAQVEEVNWSMVGKDILFAGGQDPYAPTTMWS